ncbi:MAG TPA: AAA family ATPase, partial [Bacteroidia bacterium]|nr:AAA family ATPase [Bacteroidia bacterium]
MSINYGYQKMFDSLKGRNCLPPMEAAPKKERLFGEFFYKNDFAVLCGPEGSGRSILAMQIADSISRGKQLGDFGLDSEARPVVFLDFEGNHDEFARRYSMDGKQPYPFHENFNVVRFHQKFRGYTSMRKDFLRELNTTLAPHQDGVLIINNLDYWKCFMSESYAIAAIKELQANNRFSVLLISNLKGNPAHKQITPNRAGKLLTTMTDSIFAMNFSQKGTDTRYLVQLKTKGGKQTYHANHVAEFTLSKEHNFTGCHFTGFGTEQEHTATPPTDFEMKIIELSLNQPELRLAEIADQLKTNKKRVDRVLKKYDVRDFKRSGTVDNLVTSTFENIPSPPINDAAEPLNVAPLLQERGSVELLNRPSDSGVREQFEPLDTLVTSTFKKEITPTDSLHQGNDNPP